MLHVWAKHDYYYYNHIQQTTLLGSKWKVAIVNSCYDPLGMLAITAILL